MRKIFGAALIALLLASLGYMFYGTAPRMWELLTTASPMETAQMVVVSHSLWRHTGRSGHCGRSLAHREPAVTLSTVRNVADDARQIAELLLAGIMAPAVARTAADLIGAGPAFELVLLALAWVIVGARMLSTVLALWEGYFAHAPDQTG